MTEHVGRMIRFASLAAALAASPLMAAPSVAQSSTSPSSSPQKTGNDVDDTVKKAGEIVTQPVKDVGVAKTEIPPILVAASENPYGLSGFKTCGQLSAAVKDLNAVLGPDFAADGEKKENRAGKLAEAGGKTIVNTLIPFRGLVREITGAAPAQRRLNAAVDAGFARRGFLRGIHQSRRCKPAF